MSSANGCGAPKSSLGSSLSRRCVRKDLGRLVEVVLVELLMADVDGDGVGDGVARSANVLKMLD
jgi:hypothetical protein